MPSQPIPVFVTEDARRTVAELGMHQELEAMLDWVRENVGHLTAIRVALGHPQLTVGPRILIWAHRDPPVGEPDLHLADWNWSGWKALTFPVHVCVRFTMLSAFHTPEELRNATPPAVQAGGDGAVATAG